MNHSVLKILTAYCTSYMNKSYMVFYDYFPT